MPSRPDQERLRLLRALLAETDLLAQQRAAILATDRQARRQLEALRKSLRDYIAEIDPATAP